jgi:Histidine kinase-, DNA gyrase B-, and HSP90-like ATPase
MTNGNINNRVDATPTKGFFIDMITRDISLIPAIADLVDNSIDGARRLRGDENYDGLYVRIDADADVFKISDNCGGISVEVARDYAFRFGREQDAPHIKHSIGRFGVGMKRSIFKMGRAFKVTSVTTSSRFVLDVDVTEWAANDDWHFQFSDLQIDRDYPEDETGTVLEISALRPDVSAAFGLEATWNELRVDLRNKMREQLHTGLSISVNGIPISVKPLTLLSAQGLEPAYQELVYDADSESPVHVRMYCGLAEVTERRRDSGWHVFCNGRQILRGDQSSDTGWGDDVAAFHPQYAKVRGYVFFDCDDAAKLPWNTTKTGLDTDSPIYRSTRPKMVILMKPVISFLNAAKADSEKLKSGDKGELESLVEKAPSKKLGDVQTRAKFKTPEIIKVEPIIKTQRITYEAPYDDVQKVKAALRAGSYKQVGLRTFEYYFDAEVRG